MDNLGNLGAMGAIGEFGEFNLDLGPVEEGDLLEGALGDLTGFEDERIGDEMLVPGGELGDSWLEGGSGDDGDDELSDGGGAEMGTDFGGRAVLGPRAR